MPMEMFDQMYLRHLARLPEKERPEAWQNKNITKNMKKTLKLYVNAEIEEDYLYNIVADYMQQNVVPWFKFILPDAIRVPVQDAYNKDFFRDIKILNKANGAPYISIEDLKKQGFIPEVIRYLLLNGHYRTKLNFSLSKQNEGEQAIQRIIDISSKLKYIVIV